VRPNVAAAAITERKPWDRLHPFSGYYLKALLAQGPSAPGGVRSYLVNGRLLTGFGLVVWPADYRVSGVGTFLVNHLGYVYARDLGPETSRIEAGLSRFDPDYRWTDVASGDNEK